MLENDRRALQLCPRVSNGKSVRIVSDGSERNTGAGRDRLLIRHVEEQGRGGAIVSGARADAEGADADDYWAGNRAQRYAEVDAGAGRVSARARPGKIKKPGLLGKSPQIYRNTLALAV